jgi:hypothetical protein
VCHLRTKKPKMPAERVKGSALVCRALKSLRITVQGHNLYSPTPDDTRNRPTAIILSLNLKILHEYPQTPPLLPCILSHLSSQFT